MQLRSVGKLVKLACFRSLMGIVPLLLLLAMTEQPAQAYTDPGTGALIYQIVAAGFVGMLFYVRKITSFFQSWRNKDRKN